MGAHKFDGFTPISSDHMDGVKYSAMDRKLTVRFKNGYQYEARGVSPEDYQAFLAAPSQGSHWHSQIKDRFHIERIR